MSDKKSNKRGIVIMILNIVIMICNYVLSILSPKTVDVAMATIGRVFA